GEEKVGAHECVGGEEPCAECAGSFASAGVSVRIRRLAVRPSSMADHQKYRIIDRIDSGGMAEVFRGVAESLQGFKKNVAIKRILPNLVKNKKFVSMFLDEAKLSLFLQHANIVQVFDIGQSQNSYFLVMEFVDGC